MDAPTGNPHLTAWHTLLQAHASVVGALGRELEDASGLTMSQYEVLLYLRYAPEGRMRMQDLAASVLLSKSGVTRLVDRMAAGGMVEREACESDRRVTWAGITDRGRQALREASPVHLHGIRQHFARFLSEGEAATLAQLLGKVVHGAGEPSKLSPNALDDPITEPAGAG